MMWAGQQWERLGVRSERSVDWDNQLAEFPIGVENEIEDWKVQKRRGKERRLQGE